MSSISEIFSSPSFNTHSSNNFADIAHRVVHELRSQNTFDYNNAFTFSNNSDTDNKLDSNKLNTNTHTKTVNETPEHEQEFEFPLICGDSNTSQISIDEFISTSPRYPVFDTSLLYDVNLNLCKNADPVDPLLKADSKSKLPPSRRSSLKMLFNEDRNSSSSTSTSSSNSHELDEVVSGSYCVWKPKTEPSPPPPSRGKHKKSNSISIVNGNSNESSQWKVRDLLKRSYSDDGCSKGKESPVLLFIPPVLPNEKKNKDKVTKTEKRIPAYKSKIGNIGLQPYLPYREDQVAAFANFAGRNGNVHR